MLESERVEIEQEGRKHRGFGWVRRHDRKLGLGILGVLVALAIAGRAMSNDDGTDSVLEPDARTCANVQEMIDGGMSKRDAIELAVVQADEPAADDILRVALYDC